MKSIYEPALWFLAVILLLPILAGCAQVQRPQASYAWKQVSSGVTEPINAVAVISENDIWAVGMNSMILHYDGTGWQADPQSGNILPGMHLNGLYAADQDHVWAVGDQASILFYNGATWEVQDIDMTTQDDLYAITGTDASHVYIARTGGKYRYFNGSNWSDWLQITSEASGAPLGYDCNKIAAIGEKLWIAGAMEGLGLNIGVILYYNGSAWTIPEPQDVGQALCSVAAADEKHVWAGGNMGGIFFSGATSWISQESGVTLDGVSEARLRHMKAVSANEVWAVGDPESNTGPGLILKYDDSQWNKYNCKLNEHFFGVDTFDGSNIWVVGDNGTILLGTRSN